MQSSSRVIKSTVIDDKKLISPPIFEAVISKAITAENKDFNIDEIFSRITDEANELKNKTLKDAEAQANMILLRAKNEADALLRTSKEEGFQQGYQAGYQDGYNHGVKEAGAAAEEIIQRAENYLRSCQESVSRYMDESRDQIVELGISIAKKIINTELTINSEAMFKITEGILSRAIDKSQIILKVNPMDFTLIRNRRDELSIYVEDPNSLMIVADASMGQGCLRAETPSGFIDGDIDTQLDIVLKKLLEG